MSKNISVYCGCKKGDNFETYGWVAYREKEKLADGSGVVYLAPGAGDCCAITAALGWLLTNGHAGTTTTVYLRDYKTLILLNTQKTSNRYYRQGIILSGKFRNLNFKWLARDNNEVLDLSGSAFENIEKTYGKCREGKAQKLSVRNIGSRFKVESQSRPGVFYTVDLTANTCDCPDYFYRGKRCKHIIAASKAI